MEMWTRPSLQYAKRAAEQQVCRLHLQSLAGQHQKMPPIVPTQALRQQMLSHVYCLMGQECMTRFPQTVTETAHLHMRLPVAESARVVFHCCVM